jgi:hypothetical protein
MTAHIFFTSYARLDNSDAKLGDTVKKIEGRVRALMGAAADVNIAFFDADDLRTGQEWEVRLGDTLKEAKIIVCMCSPTYVNSAYCAKEFEVFRRRLIAAADQARGKVAIVPVVWEPGALPEAILRYQLKDARFPDPYGKTVGLSQFSRLKSQSDKLDDVIEVLAEIINDAEANANLPAWTDEIRFDDLPSFLQHPKPEPYKNMTLTVLHDDAAQWKMGGVRKGIGAIADVVASDLHIALEIIDPNAATLPQKLDAARTARHMSIVAVAFDDAQTPPWQQMLAQVDQAGRTNCAVLVGFRQPELTSATDIQAKLKQLLPQSSTPGSRHSAFALNDEKGCANALKAAVAALQMDLITEDKNNAQQVDSQELRDEAAKQGIALDARPTVSSSDGASS